MKNLPFILALALINSCIELEISVPSFPEIQTYFSVSQDWIGLTMTMNLIGFCFASFFHGPLSDAYGRRRIMLIGTGFSVLEPWVALLRPPFLFFLSLASFKGWGLQRLRLSSQLLLQIVMPLKSRRPCMVG